jgi:hypothetical protein
MLEEGLLRVPGTDRIVERLRVITSARASRTRASALRTSPLIFEIDLRHRFFDRSKLGE